MDGGGTEGAAVIAVVTRDRLSAVLTAVHRGGQGHNARVLDPARGQLLGQLRRAGIQQAFNLDPRARDTVLVLIHAPGRIAKTVDLFRRAGEFEVHVVGRAGTGQPPAPVGAYPDTRLRVPADQGEATPSD
ncbi:MAG TPA: hypothetical protein VH482_23155 [Thermomicrobiales bacterium]